MGVRTQQRNNILAGLFLISALLLAVFISFWVEEGFDKLPFVKPRAEYVVRFDIARGVPGLKPGSPVTLGGKQVGSVASIEYTGDSVDGRLRAEAIDVAMKIDSWVVLYDDARVVIVTPLMGSLSSINITDIGGGTGALVLAPGGVVGAARPGGLADLDGLAEEVQGFVAKATELLDQIGPEVQPIVQSARETLDISREFAEELRLNQEKWIAKADSILEGADAVFRDTLPGVAGEVFAGVGDARRFIGTVQDVVEENRADIRRTISNLEGISTRARYDVLGRVERVLDEGLIAAANMGDVGSRLLGTIDRLEPALSRTMSNFQIASAQSALLIEEIRAAPWRALKEPSEKEKREEVLYSAVRRYADSVERLRGASESLESVLRGARLGGREVAPEQVLDMTEEIKRSFSAYSKAEQDLLSLIARQTGGGR